MNERTDWLQQNPGMGKLMGDKRFVRDVVEAAIAREQVRNSEATPSELADQVLLSLDMARLIIIRHEGVVNQRDKPQGA